LKSDQGKVKCCSYNINKHNKKFSLSERCLICLKKFNAIFEKLEASFKEASFATLPKALNLEEFSTPSISVIDPDNSNICMCNDTPIESSRQNNRNMCIICRNIIEQQPSERCTLISEKTMFGDVIVNRIDSQHHLTSTYASNLLQIKKLQDPYTPESIESHSPQPEMDEKYFPINDLEESQEIIENVNEVEKHSKSLMNEAEETHNHDIISTENHYNSSHSVTPSQLTTRLEILRRESQFVINDESTKCGNGSVVSDADNDNDKSLNRSESCLRCSCSIA
jgi:hypothetical protein